MSPDDIFAAQIWPWPDPVIKRDNAGRVLFINAAFLSLYGGRVETWTGQPVMGWPAPNPQGQPHRFETRAGQAPQEIVYDWVEVMMADGNALAIARDVTAYQPPGNVQPVPEAEFAPAPPAPHFDAAPAAPPAAYGQADAVPQAPTPDPVQAFTPEIAPKASHNAAPEILPEAFKAPAFETTAQTPPPEINVAPAAPHVEAPAPETVAPAPVSGDLQGLPVSARLQETSPAAPVLDAAPAPAPQIAAPPVAPPQVAEDNAAPKRDFERRALPIENDEAVLGSNWRDAVIARAVGGALTQAEDAPAEPEVPAPEPVTSRTEKEPLRILLAEDNAINALLTRTLLEADGCVVETVEDGALAVEAVSGNSYDLILMDMRMPNMDGLEATRKIRAMGGERADKLPIIALTANAFDDDRNACFDSGMNDFMTKPVSAEELTAMVAQWVAKTRESADNAMAS